MYTHSKKADALVKSDLETIKKIIIEQIPDVISIILFGSFGQGEGSFLANKNKIEILGDYDLYLITKKNINETKLKKIAKDCALAIGKGGLDVVEDLNEEYDSKKYFHVDIRAIPHSKINKLLPTQRTFDLKNSQIIYGEDIRSSIPDVKISLSEALRLLFNQANYLLIGKNKPKELKIICSMKVIQNCCSALLISENNYSSSYAKRNEFFQKSESLEEFKKLTELSTRFKLKTFFNVDENDMWNKAKYFLDFSIKYILKKQANRDIKDWKDAAYFISNKLPYTYFSPYLPSRLLFPTQYYLNLKFVESSIRKGDFFLLPLFTWKDVGLKIAAALLLYLFDEQDEARKYMRKITTSNKYEFEERILNLFTNYYSQKLI